jgi:hypothetical protein
MSAAQFSQKEKFYCSNKYSFELPVGLEMKGERAKYMFMYHQNAGQNLKT